MAPPTTREYAMQKSSVATVCAALACLLLQCKKAQESVPATTHQAMPQVTVAQCGDGRDICVCPASPLTNCSILLDPDITFSSATITCPPSPDTHFREAAWICSRQHPAPGPLQSQCLREYGVFRMIDFDMRSGGHRLGNPGGRFTLRCSEGQALGNVSSPEPRAAPRPPRVEYRGQDRRWGRGYLAAVRTPGTCTVVNDPGDSRSYQVAGDDVRWPFAVGDRVEVNWAGRWYAGVVQTVVYDGSYEVRLDSRGSRAQAPLQYDPDSTRSSATRSSPCDQVTTAE